MLMKLSTVGLIAACCVMWACDETKEEPFNLKGTIKGNVQTISEFGWLTDEQEGVTVAIGGDSPFVSTLTDEDGNFLLENVPTGTHTFTMKKENHGTFRLKGFAFVGGGEEPVYASFALSAQSTTKAQDVSLSRNGTVIYAEGTIIHSNTSIYPYVRIAVFLGDSPDVSPENHLQSFTGNASVPSGSEFTVGFVPSKRLFPSQTKLYAVIYGVPSSGYTVFDPVTNKAEYPGIGATPSNVPSIDLP